MLEHEFKQEIVKLKERYGENQLPDIVVDFLWDKVKSHSAIIFSYTVDKIIFSQKTCPTGDQIYREFLDKERYEERKRQNSWDGHDDNYDPVPFTFEESREMFAMIRGMVERGVPLQEQKQQVMAMCKMVREREYNKNVAL